MKRLYLRIYLAVLLAIVLSVVLAGTAWRFLGDRSELMRQREFFVAAAQAMLPPASAPNSEQQAALDKWHGLSGFNLALLDRRGNVIAMAGEVDLRPVYRRRGDRWRDNWYRRIRLNDGRLLVGQHDPRRGGPLAGLGILVVLLLIGISVAVVAFPFVRRLTRRLEALETGVADFGTGNLAARVDIKGKDEVARLAATFNTSAERIEQLVTANKTMLANASHELRSPLARLRMAVEALGDRAPESLRSEINQNVRELDQLVEEILTASRMDVNGVAASGFQPVDLVALAAEECAHASADLDVQGDVPAVRGDEKLLRRVLRNLLENAARYGGGTQADVTLRNLSGSGVELRVCDRGHGVPEADRERIFEPFFRRGGASEASGGVGLGLALVRQIGEAHGGSVTCAGRDGGGACFVVELAAY